MYEAPEKMIGMPESSAPEQVVFTLGLGRATLSVTRDVVYKYTDPVHGEVYQPLEILPEVTVSVPEKVMIFATKDEKQIPVTVRAGRDNVSGTLQINHPEGWKVTPATQAFTISKSGTSQTILQ